MKSFYQTTVKDYMLSPKDQEQEKDVYSYHFYSTFYWLF